MFALGHNPRLRLLVVVALLLQGIAWAGGRAHATELPAAGAEMCAHGASGVVVDRSVVPEPRNDDGCLVHCGAILVDSALPAFALAPSCPDALGLFSARPIGPVPAGRVAGLRQARAPPLG